MKYISDLFEYMFYRIATIYAKLDISRGSTGIWAVVVCQLFLIFDLFALVVYGLFEKDERTIIFQYSKFGIIVLGLLLFRYNHKKYDPHYWLIHKRWKDEPKPQKIRNTILVIFMVLLPVLAPMIILFERK
jgi:hypothetical protein